MIMDKSQLVVNVGNFFAQSMTGSEMLTSNRKHFVLAINYFIANQSINRWPISKKINK